MPKPLRVLIVEDNERDAALLVRELRRGGYDPDAERVETAETLRAALERQAWDVVLSDYFMPRFSAPAALSMVKERGHELPFIIVSGTVGEETAVEAMRAGAHDFMTKGMLARLLPAIEREMRDAAVRAQRKKMQEQLLIAERLASVGMLAASVAHEINNPLTAIAGNLEFTAQSLAEVTTAAGATEAPPHLADTAQERFSAQTAAKLLEAMETLREAQEAAERVRLIVRDLKLFSRSGDEEQRGPVELERLIESSIRMASNEIRHRARLVREYQRVPPVEANEARLGQAFLNLIVNAAQAIPDGKAGANEIKIAIRPDGTNRVAVEITDTGIGIPPDVLPRIFDPFFTTKPAGVGTGLGLAICHRIITSLGGDISIHSQVTRGTTFHIGLPCAQAAGPEKEVAAMETPGARRGRVLVIDDEPQLCTVIQRTLGAEHEVTAVTSAREALDLIRTGRRFDLVLCDLMMPQMTGMEFHAELSREAPDLAARMIFMTGGAFSEEATNFLAGIPNSTVEKPFKTAALRLLVRNQLERVERS